MIVSVASGKGGTGKTTVALMMALGSPQAELVDCDVEEPNCHLFLNPEMESRTPVEVKVPSIIPDRCDGCGDCVKVCRFAALVVAGGKAMVFPELCHSCGGCRMACKRNAIREDASRIGELDKGVGTGDYGYVHLTAGKMDPGVPAGGPLIRAIKSQIMEFENTIVDCPPGTSCSMAMAVYGSDACLLVTEPNALGFHDLELAVDVLKEIGISRRGVVINKSEPGQWLRKIQELCYKKEIPVIAEIPYSRSWAAAYAGGKLPDEAAGMGRKIWEEVRLAWPSR